MNPENPGDNPLNPGATPDNPGDSGATVLDESSTVLDERAPGADEAAEESLPDQNELPARPAGAGGRAGGRWNEYDWPSIRRRYVEGVKAGDDGLVQWPSLDAVAEHFGVNPTRVREKSGQEGWRTQRVQWQAQVEQTRRQAKAAAMSKEATQLDGSALQTAKVGLGLVTHRLQQIARQRDTIPIDAQEQQRLAQAADLWHKIGLRAVGDPETHRLEITGAGGAPIEIATELRRDDPSRMAGVLGVLAQAGLGDLFGGAKPGEIVDGEVVGPREVEQ